MAYNSTIRAKQGICPLCSTTKKQPLIGGMCQKHYWSSRKMKSAQKQQEKELSEDKDLKTLIDDLDIIFSRYIRSKDADWRGVVECYTCGEQKHYKHMDCGHFMPRGNMYTRFSEENCKPQCKHCNGRLRGNLIKFAEKLEQERPGIVEQLQQQACTEYHYSRDELKGLISACSKKLKHVQKGVLK